MVGTLRRRDLLALAATSSLAGCSSVLSSSGTDDPDCGMLGDGDSEVDRADDVSHYVLAQLVTESAGDSDREAVYQDAPEEATVVPYDCLGGRDVESLRQIVRRAAESGDVEKRREFVSVAEAERITALLPEYEHSSFVAYDGRVTHVYVSATWETDPDAPNRSSRRPLRPP